MGVRKLTDIQELVICQEYIDGLSTRQVARKHSVGKTVIYNVLKRNNIERRPVGRERTYNCNDDFFNIIDNETKAYWLGFWEADGCLKGQGNCIVLKLARKDRNQLEKFLSDIESDYKIYDRKDFDKRTKKWYFSSSITIYSEKIKTALLRYKEEGFNRLPEFLKSHYIRGVFDGDGCISNQKTKSRFSIIGNPFLIQEIQQYLMKECNLNKTKLEKHLTSSSVVYLRYGGRRQLKRIYEFLYKDVNIYMERKRNIFVEIGCGRY